MIYLFNTRSKTKEVFTPLKNNEVSMYHCGPTVYDRAHIGNLRVYVVADILRRMFEYKGFSVRQVINITDVGHLTSDADEGEDKIEEAARQKRKSAKDIAALYTNDFYKDLDRLNVIVSDTHFPKASEHIKAQIALIEKLEKKGLVYRTTNGMYFDTKKSPGYGKFGHIKKQHLNPDGRIAKDPEKKNFEDFALWRFSSSAGPQKRQQEWDSPWGIGFPGWHIECSAMAMEYLGETLDIHTGGTDHIPVHHTNEIAQSESVTEKPLARYWLHSEFLTINGKKMAKSEGNIVTLEDIVQRGFSPLAYRYWLLLAHYRSPVNFTWEALEGAQNALKNLYERVQEYPKIDVKISSDYQKSFEKLITDDLDVPRALALVWNLVKDKSLASEVKRATLLDFDNILGIGLNRLKHEPIPVGVSNLAKEREEVRKNGDFEKSDKLRENIQNLGFDVEDTDEGPKLKKR